MATGAADVPQVNPSSVIAHNPDSPRTGVEMSDLQRQQQAGQGGDGEPQPSATEMSTTAASAPEATVTSITRSQPQESPIRSLVGPETSTNNATDLTPAAESTFLGGAQDGSSPSEAIAPVLADSNVDSSSTRSPVVDIVLLPMNGNRYPCKISAKYLRNQKIEVENMDPFNISVYTLKELIWRDWKGDWETRPTNPGAIRLINMGRVLEDKQLLKDCRFSTNFPTVLHMSVKPQQDADDEDGKVGKAGSRADRDDSERTAGCRCVIL